MNLGGSGRLVVRMVFCRVVRALRRATRPSRVARVTSLTQRFRSTSPSRILPALLLLGSHQAAGLAADLERLAGDSTSSPCE